MTRQISDRLPRVALTYAVDSSFTGELIKTKNIEIVGKQKTIHMFRVIASELPIQIKIGDAWVETDVKADSSVEFLAPSRLEVQLSQVQVGEKIKITYKGKDEAGRGPNKAHIFNVEVL